MKKHLTLLLLFCYYFVNSQNVVGNDYLSPKGLLENNFDNYGNSFTLNQLQVKNATNYLVNTVGVFQLYYEAGSGMEIEDNTIHDQRRAVINKVFEDVSLFLNSPLKNNPNAPKIKIWIRNFKAVQNLNPTTIAYGTSFYNVAKNIASTAIIDDNHLWKIINSGSDPYLGITSVKDENNQNLNFFHAALAINTTLNWNTNLNISPAITQYDLYSFVLREVVHALGFNSLIDNKGKSKLGTDYNYYSRFDTFITNNNGLKLLSNPMACSTMDSYIYLGNGFNLGEDCISNNNANPCSKAGLFVGTNTIKLATPSCFDNATTFQFVNKTCNNALANKWLMDNAMGKGDMQRYMNPYERQILLDLGYGFASAFGKTNRLNYINYNSNLQNTSVVGRNDGLDEYSFSIQATIAQEIILNNLLVNDTNATGIECVKDVTASNTVIGYNSNDVKITFNTSGLHLLSYVPYKTSSGKRGNITYAYVYVQKADCPAPAETCNLVINGGFEENIGIPDKISQFEKLVCNWRENYSGSPDYFHVNVGSVGIPVNFAGTQNVNPTFGGNAYAGIINELDVGFGDKITQRYKEIMIGNLVTPIQANKNYTLTFDVSFAENYGQLISEIQVLLTPDFPVLNGAFGDVPANPGEIFHDNDNQVADTQNWTTLTFNFNSGASSGQKFISIGSLRNPLMQNATGTFSNKSYYYIDNVVLREVNNPVLNIQPDPICVTAPAFDLNTMLTGGVTGGFFTVNGTPITGTIFNPATYGTGTHTVTYTVPSPIACPQIVVTDTITIKSCTPAQKPYISQVYVGATNNKVIEVKNGRLS